MRYRFRAWVIYSLTFQYLVIGGYYGIAVFIGTALRKSLISAALVPAMIGISGLIYALSLVFWPYKRQRNLSSTTPPPTPVTSSDPFADRETIEQALSAAANLIRAGQYTNAVAVLEPIKSDPKAAEWLKKLSDPKYK